VKAGYPDHTALDKQNHHYDPASTKENPRWYMVDVKLDKIFDKPLSLEDLKKVKSLAKMELLRKGSRLSVQRVTEEEFEIVLDKAGVK
jgi:predicted RNA-binding protein with PUA-like domain